MCGTYSDRSQRLQSKIKNRNSFQHDFEKFLRWLIGIVFGLASCSDDAENLPKFERIILKDIRNFRNEYLITEEFLTRDYTTKREEEFLRGRIR